MLPRVVAKIWDMRVVAINWDMRVVAINWDMRVVAINWDMFGRIKRNAIPKNNFKNLRTVQIDDGKVKNKEKK